MKLDLETESACFSSSYQSARTKFIETAQKAGGDIRSFKHPESGPDGKPLFIDVAFFGTAENTSALVVSSGTHGVEGFAGSGIQTGLLSEGIKEILESGLNLIMIHALNPYGMAYIRRFTEDNVDLNRNFIDHTSAYPENREYDELASVIAPPSISFWSEVGSWSRLFWFRLIRGKHAVQSVISKGQYSHPTGLFYGGNGNTWSNDTIRSIVHEYLENAQRVVIIDIHTGLGEYGHGEVILNSPADSQEYQRAIHIWGPSIVRSTITGKSVSVHLESTLKLALPKMLPQSEVTAVSLEFGTLPPLEVFRALRAENWLHHHGGPEHARAREIKTCLLRAFYPDDKHWKKSVWQQGKAIVKNAISNLKT